MNVRPFKRPDRYAHELSKMLGEIFFKEIDLSSIGFVTITHVKMSKDLKLARVYLSVLNRKVKKSAVEKYFKAKKGVIRGVLGSMIRSKSVPDLAFFYDETYEEVEKLDRLLNKIHLRK
ncbi:MAG: 30S ribosome-binding factor RbfA [Candidatus Marinimicrobia bacterium]|nr:30S ribosome-binding factor RbfA [Candidatus Neomarinimicrobiota bacterium]